MGTGTVLEVIREATRTSHRRLDMALSRLDVSIPLYYEAFLISQAEALFPIEATLEASGIGDVLPDWMARARTEALKHDLAALSLAVTSLPVPTFRSTAEMLGAVYVLEASRMGERVMLARLAENPDSEAINATAYLRHGFGKRLWPKFLAVLENHPDALRNSVARARRENRVCDVRGCPCAGRSRCWKSFHPAKSLALARHPISVRVSMRVHEPADTSRRQ